jgi:hypothetical protein
MTVTSALSALLGALEGHDLAPDIHEAIADANAALMRDADTGPDGVSGVFASLAAEVAEWANDPLSPSGTALGGILARHGLVNVAEVDRLREQVAELRGVIAHTHKHVRYTGGLEGACACIYCEAARGDS